MSPFFLDFLFYLFILVYIVVLRMHLNFKKFLIYLLVI
jgi:hypothetical protein